MIILFIAPALLSQILSIIRIARSYRRLPHRVINLTNCFRTQELTDFIDNNLHNAL